MKGEIGIFFCQLGYLIFLNIKNRINIIGLWDLQQYNSKKIWIKGYEGNRIIWFSKLKPKIVCTYQNKLIVFWD